MKKITSLILVSALLAALLTGCSRNAETVDETENVGNFTPEAESEIIDALKNAAEAAEELPEVIDVPVEETEIIEEAVEIPAEEVATEEDAAAEEDAVPTPSSTPDTSLATYTFQTLSDTSFGFVFTHPVNWVNYPGKHTVCFREPDEDGSYPARVAITRKKMVHKPDPERILEQFKEYGATIKEEYDDKTFEWGELNSSAKFMGKPAYEIPYLAYSGDTEIQGYLICTAVEYTIYVYHFHCAYPEYGDMKNLMTMMRDSVKLVE